MLNNPVSILNTIIVCQGVRQAGIVRKVNTEDKEVCRLLSKLKLSLVFSSQSVWLSYTNITAGAEYFVLFSLTLSWFYCNGIFYRLPWICWKGCSRYVEKVTNGYVVLFTGDNLDMLKILQWICVEYYLLP